MYICEYQTPIIGKLILASDGEGLCDCWFENDRFCDREKFCETACRDDLSVFTQARKWLDRYFAKEEPSARELPLAPQGTEFQMLVREAMLEIPYGQTRTYGQLAKAIEERTGKPRSARAVGGAVGRNPLCLIVPCHRVMGAGGNLTGFGGGIATKIRLLEHEGVDVSAFHMPRKVPTWNDAIEQRNAQR